MGSKEGQELIADLGRMTYGALDRLRLVGPLKNVFYAFQRNFPKLRDPMDKILLRYRGAMSRSYSADTSMYADAEWYDNPRPKGKEPFVSIIVPNYNHEKYLRQRLDSIYGQTYRNYEVILLDDCSSDDSRTILNEYRDRYPDRTRCEFNETNSGGVFRQWRKGISLAKGDYIWIAESDDWCDPNFLEELVPMLDYQSVMIAFSPSVFMRDGQQTWSTEEYLKDTKFDWNNPFLMTANDAMSRGFAVMNIIPNVSSAVFRNIGSVPEEVEDMWGRMKLCGDWAFYLDLIKGGAIAYTNRTVNYYRIHSGSTSLNVQHTERFYLERAEISKYVARNYRVDPEVFDENLRVLKEHYVQNNYGDDPSVVESWYVLDDIVKEMESRRPSVMMCCYSFQMGGGELFAIHLANALKDKGCPVTFADFNLDTYSNGVRELLRPDIPVITISDYESIGRIEEKYGIDVVHTHHGSVDKIVAKFGKESCRHIVTLHGMYESSSQDERSVLVRTVYPRCARFAYIADKNLVPFKDEGLYDPSRFVKIGNGLEPGCPEAVPRDSLGIPEDAFVLCLVSRALPEKGWMEAKRCVISANERGGRPIHLVLVGSGEAYDLVQKEPDQHIHAVGQRNNPRAYYAMADAGILPSYYSGESYPLSIIECLMCGKPVIASDIGEIPSILDDGDGNKAGILFSLEDGRVPEGVLTDIIRRLADDYASYSKLLPLVKKAAERQDIGKVADRYVELYSD